jgi:hypothetical protein
MRIFATSDLHTDFRDNWLLLKRLHQTAYLDDVLLVAGDIADSLSLISDTLALLRSRFYRVFYVPGNHELWVRREAFDSLEKLRRILEICDGLDVQTGPARLRDVWVVPLFSWYDASFDPEGVAELRAADLEELEGWADYYFCQWPDSIGSVSEYFRKLNGNRIKQYDGPVISLSHFVPRRELLPATEELKFKALLKVAGCASLDLQIRAIKSVLHVFGHSHINCDTSIAGVRYVQHVLGYPKEGRRQIFPEKVVWDSEEPQLEGASRRIDARAENEAAS